MQYFQVDVFAEKPLQGNGLTVVFPPQDMVKTAGLLALTQEFKQFETIFLYRKKRDWRGRVFLR